ncbi:MAG: PAS domain-containing protein [Vallitaleaceae bacterium]|nr:PAS domain-containing protein [Vallitaleaceae bacterium]
MANKSKLIKAEDKTKQSKRYLRGLLDRLQDLVYQTDSRGIITYANKAFARMYSCSVADLTGLPIRRLYLKEDHRELLEQELDTRKGILIDYLVYVRKGIDSEDSLYLSVDSSWIQNDPSKGIEGAGRDVTKSIRSLDGFMQTNKEGITTFCSEELCNLYGYSEGPKELMQTTATAPNRA